MSGLAGSQAVLTELARVRLHGFLEQEVEAARAASLSEMQAVYLEREQLYSQATAVSRWRFQAYSRVQAGLRSRV